MSQVLEGVGKRLELHPDHVVIRRTDILASVVPSAFGGRVKIPMDQIEYVHLYQPERLRLEDCEGNCLRFIIIQRDHNAESMMLNQKQLQAAQEIRAAIESHITALAKVD